MTAPARTGARPVHLALDDLSAPDATLCCDRRFWDLLPAGHHLTADPANVTCPAYVPPAPAP